MGRRNKGDFAAKHGADATANPVVRGEIESRISGNEIPCAVAFEIAASTDTRPAEVGKTADLMNLRLVKCQLGLFGYSGGKIVKPQPPGDPDLTAAIESASVDQRLSCEQAWSIAARFNLRKLNFGGVCEALGVKIKPCQLGAF